MNTKYKGPIKPVMLQCNHCGSEFPAGCGHECPYEKLKADNKRLREALEFYADTKNWSVEIIKDDGNKHRIAHVVTGDSGDIARKILEEISDAHHREN